MGDSVARRSPIVEENQVDGAPLIKIEKSGS